MTRQQQNRDDLIKFQEQAVNDSISRLANQCMAMKASMETLRILGGHRNGMIRYISIADEFLTVFRNDTELNHE